MAMQFALDDDSLPLPPRRRDASPPPASKRCRPPPAEHAEWQRALHTVYGPQSSAPPCGAAEGAAEGEAALWWQQLRAEVVADRSLRALDEAAAAREEEERRGEGREWRGEWGALRAEQLRLQGEAQMATPERLAPGRPESIEWIHEIFRSQICQLVREGWASSVASAYTLLACCAPAAMARATREQLAAGGGGGAALLRVEGEYAASRRLVAAVLLQRAAEQTTAAPLTYAHLHGALGLIRNDSAWARLTPDAPLGATFVSSALVAAANASDAFPNGRGFHAHICRSGVRDWMLMDSDVVCFESLPRQAEWFRSLVDVGGGGFHLPAGAAIELVAVHDKFRVPSMQGVQWVKRRLYTVRVRFPLAPSPPQGTAADGSAAGSPERERTPAGEGGTAARSPPPPPCDPLDYRFGRSEVWMMHCATDDLCCAGIHPLDTV
ncbi:hypothetical protein AB1Y20_016581 [Prymnesium parvum]|uniref:Uncharacterized protein n=1 Tax=Prymnesium parvum TaxID=97485 RepID=A0AB34ICS7_PRYPA